MNTDLLGPNYMPLKRFIYIKGCEKSVLFMLIIIIIRF